jgi:hypothetical protein
MHGATNFKDGHRKISRRLVEIGTENLETFGGNSRWLKELVFLLWKGFSCMKEVLRNIQKYFNFRMKEVLRKIHKYFDFLFEDGFEVAKYVGPEGFGNWIVYLQSNKFVIRIIQDRDEISVEGAFPSKRVKDISRLYFISLDAILGYFSNDVTYDFFKRTPREIDVQFAKIARKLKSNYERICSFFEKSNYARDKDDFELFLERRREHFLGPYGYKPRKK